MIGLCGAGGAAVGYGMGEPARVVAEPFHFIGVIVAAFLVLGGTTAVIFFFALRPARTTDGKGGEGSDITFAETENAKAAVAIRGSLMFVALAYLIAAGTGVSPHATLAVTPQAIFLGLAGVAPMLLVLVSLETIKHPRMIAFRDHQIRFFANIGFRFTPLRILLMSLGAGIGEELLFRGALQAWLDDSLPVALAIILPSVVFGLLHNNNLIYMIIAGVIGLYLGVLFAVTGNILVPIIAHTVYDVIAFAYTNILIRRYPPEPTPAPEPDLAT
ncbi:MAG: type II CAAX endopeptidase family protein [Pseudomonadota bacterium]